MSVIAQTEDGCILDHRKFSTLTVDAEKSSECGQHFILKKALFEINKPFRMDSQFEKIQNSCEKTTDNTRIRKKRKRKMPMNTGELLAEKYHQEVKGYITKAYTELSALGRKKEYFLAQCPPDVCDNNVAARQASLLDGGGPDFIEQCQQKPVTTRRVKIHEGMDLSDHCMVNVIMEYDGCSSVLVKHQSRQYFIPSHCSFLMSDIDYLKMFAKDLGRYDTIVMDPPWENKAVKRQKKYYTLDNGMILDIPLHELMMPGCLVVVWVTNKQKHIKFVIEELFPRNGIEFVARWYWLKVTKSAACVFDLNSPHKKPYETLIIGQLRKACYHGDGNAEEVRDNTDSNHTEDDDNGCHGNGFPDNQVIVSIPCSLHSKKPPLLDVLKQYLPENPRCLELFARNLLPNWTSWGNEVLYHQGRDFFEEVT